VLGVVDDLAAVGHEETRGVLDHGEVFLGRGTQNFVDVEQPRLADERHHRHAAGQEGLELGILAGFGAGAARGAEGGDLRVLEPQLADLVEVGDVARI